MSVYVTGVGIVSAIGFGVSETLLSLEAGKTGMAPLSLFNSIYKGILPVGEVKASCAELKEKLGISKSKTVSRTAMLAMLAAKQAYDDAELHKRKNNMRIGLISGTSVGGMDLSENFYAQFAQNPASGRLRDIVSHDCAASTEQTADYLGITDFVTTISTACSSAANAIMLGARMLENNMLDCVIVGGTDALCKFTLNGFASLKIVDENLCRPFDKSRTGLNLGEGAAYLVLEREPINSNNCKLAGYANTCEAFHQTASSPNGEGPFMCMDKAIKNPTLQACDIDYINLHGTGTPNNDIAEGNAVKRLFGNKVPMLSSTKAFTGHTLGAAGGVEAVLSVLSITKGIAYPNLGFNNPVEEHGLIPITALFKGEIKAVLSNSFGFGGNNSSLVFTKV